MEKNKQLLAVGNKIRKLREASGFSQENFAMHMGMARSFYGRVERGEQNISLLNLIKIAAGLNVEVGELFPPLRELKN